MTQTADDPVSGVARGGGRAGARRPVAALALALVAAVLAGAIATTAGPAAARAVATPPPDAAPLGAPTTFTIEGGGWGHGVGMSQYGAQGRALAGHTAAQILGFYYPGTDLATRSVGDGLRVHVATSTSMTITSVGSVSVHDETGATLWTSSGAATVVFDRDASGRVRARSGGVNRCVVSGVDRCGTGTVTLRHVPGERVRTTASVLLDAYGTSGHAYQWGAIELVPRAAGGLYTVVADLDMQQYLDGLAEVPASWPDAALESQAIAGRTFAMAKVLARRASGSWTRPWDLYSSVYDQYYGGWERDGDATAAPWRDAVARTADQVLLHGGAPFDAVYSSSNGGWTEDSGYVWTTSLPYLPAQEDTFDATADNPNASWSVTYTASELGAWLTARTGTAIGEVTGVMIGGNVGASSRTDRATVTVVGTLATVAVSGPTFRASLNAHAGPTRQLRSTRFWMAGTVADSGESISGAEGTGAVEVIARRHRRVVAKGWVSATVDGTRPQVQIRIGKRVRRTVEARRVRRDVAVETGAARHFRISAHIGPRARTRAFRVCILVVDPGGGPSETIGCRRLDPPAT